MLVITPTSGSLIAASSAIWPKPRMPISSTITCVPSGAARIASGSPISVFQFCGFDATARCGATSAVIRSLVDVLPTEPVTAITWAARQRRHRRVRHEHGAGVRGDGRARPLRGDDDAPGACVQHVGREGAAVDVLTW